MEYQSSASYNFTPSCRYIFTIYDFDESGMLSVDETILAVRSTVSGLSKICGLEPPQEAELEAMALMVSITYASN